MAATENSIKVQFYNSKALKECLKARSGDATPVSLVAQRDLERYYEALDRALPVLTEDEATMLVNALNGKWHADPVNIALLWAEVADDDPALADRLRKMSFIECVAIVDAVERFWQGPYHQEESIASRLREVGLVR
jgi:hypothetical protein